MQTTEAKIDSKRLATEIAKEIDEMNMSGFGSTTAWAVGEYLGMQVQIVITRDEDEMLPLKDEDDLIEFKNVGRRA